MVKIRVLIIVIVLCVLSAVWYYPQGIHGDYYVVFPGHRIQSDGSIRAVITGLIVSPTISSGSSPFTVSHVVGPNTEFEEILGSTSTNASGEFEIETRLGWHGYVSNKFPIPLRMMDSKEADFWLTVSINDEELIEKQIGPIIIGAITDEGPITIDVGDVIFPVPQKKEIQ